MTDCRFIPPSSYAGRNADRAEFFGHDFTVGQRVLWTTGKCPATVVSIGRGTDANAVRIMVEHAQLPVDSRACFLKPID